MRQNARRLIALAALGLSMTACAEPTRPATAVADAPVRLGAWEPAPMPRAMDAHQAAYAAPKNPGFPVLYAPFPLPPGHFR